MKKETIKIDNQLEKMLKTHDWYFEKTDDNAFYRLGYLERKAIVSELSKYNTNEAVSILKNYAPKDVDLLNYV